MSSGSPSNCPLQHLFLLDQAEPSGNTLVLKAHLSVLWSPVQAETCKQAPCCQCHKTLPCPKPAVHSRKPPLPPYHVLSLSFLPEQGSNHPITKTQEGIQASVCFPNRCETISLGLMTFQGIFCAKNSWASSKLNINQVPFWPLFLPVKFHFLS